MAVHCSVLMPCPVTLGSSIAAAAATVASHCADDLSETTKRSLKMHGE